MSIEILGDESDPNVVLEIEGPLDFGSSEAFIRALEEVESRPAPAEVVTVDMTLCPSVDSAGIGMLLMLHDSLTRKCASGPRCVLRGCGRELARLLSIVHVDEQFALEPRARG